MGHTGVGDTKAYQKEFPNNLPENRSYHLSRRQRPYPEQRPKVKRDRATLGELRGLHGAKAQKDEGGWRNY